MIYGRNPQCVANLTKLSELVCLILSLLRVATPEPERHRSCGYEL